MKNIKYFFAAAAAALLSFSCTVEFETVNEEELNPGFEYVFRVSSDAQNATKTVLNGTSVEWETGDKIAVYAEGSTNRYGAISSLNPVVFPVSLAAALDAGSKVYAYYPYNSNNASNEADAVTLSIPTNQRGDFDNMPQVALPYTTTADFVSGNNNVGDLYFCNLGSVIQFLVYSSGGTYTSETVESIVFNADKALAGVFSFDLTAVDYSNLSTLNITGYSATRVKLEPTAAPTIGTTTGDAGTTNMIVAPGTYYGTIVLTTDEAIYTYTLTESNKIAFARNSIKKIGLNLESANVSRLPRHAVDEVFVPATSISAGDKVLLTSGTSGSVYVMGEQRTNNRGAVSCSVDSGAIISTADTYPMIVGTGSTEPSYFTLFDPIENGFLYAASSSANNLKTEDIVSKNSEWEIAIDGESKATTLQASGGSYSRNVMQFNSSSSIFSCYASATQKAIYVFKKTDATFISAANQDIAYTVTSVEIPYNVYNGSGATTVAFKTNPGTCASNLAINEGTKKVTFDITSNTGDTRTVEVNITNNGVTKTVSINQAASPTQLVMSSITATPSQNQIVFSWEAVENAVEYQISIDGGSSYGITQTATSYTWTGLTSFTSYTIKVKAIGDDIYYTDSDPGSLTAKTTLALPTSITWTKGTKTVSWTDTNTGAGTYGTDYKYQYTIDNGVSFTDVAAPGTSVVLSIDVSKVFKIKAVYISDTSLNSALSSGTDCSVGDTHYYVKASTITAGGKYILVNRYSSTDYICSGLAASNKMPVIDASDLIVGEQIVSNSTTDTYAVTISGETDSYSIVNSNSKYLTVSTGNVSVANSTTQTWKIIKQSDNTWKFVNSTTNTRALFIGASGSACKNYATSNLGGSGYASTYFDLYKYE